MKYKIKDTEVEAMFFNWGNRISIAQYLKERFGDLIVINMDEFEFELGDKTQLRYKEGSSQFIIHFFKRSIRVNYGDFIVITDDSILSINSDYFEKIAVKLKPPRFKIGDFAFRKKFGTIKDCNFTKVRIIKVHNHLDYSYDCDSDGYTCLSYEHDLFTLEEAIEKLNEL